MPLKLVWKAADFSENLGNVCGANENVNTLFDFVAEDHITARSGGRSNACGHAPGDMCSSNVPLARGHVQRHRLFILLGDFKESVRLVPREDGRGSDVFP